MSNEETPAEVTARMLGQNFAFGARWDARRIKQKDDWLPEEIITTYKVNRQKLNDALIAYGIEELWPVAEDAYRDEWATQEIPLTDLEAL